MPKIPVFTTQAKPTTEVSSITSNIQISPTALGSALLPAAAEVSNYFVKQRDNVEKLEAKKKFYEMKAEADKIIEKQKNNPDEVGSVDTFNQQFGSYKDQQLSQVTNGRVKKMLEQYLSLEQSESVYKLKTNSFKAYEAESISTYNTEQNSYAAEYSLETDQNKKNIIKEKRKQSAIEFNQAHMLGKSSLEKELKKIETDSVIFDADKAIAGKNYGLALEVLKKADTKKVNSEEIQKKLLQIEKEGAEYKENNFYAANLLQGNNLLIGATYKNTTEKKAIQHTENILVSQAQKNKLSPEQTFAYIDETMAKNGIVSPSYKNLMEAGYNAGSTTTFDSPTDVPKTLLQAVKAAETADKLGRLNVYTNNEQERFYKNIIVLKKVKGLDDYQAIKQAKEFEQNYDANIIKGASKQRIKTLADIEEQFSKSKSTNVNEVRGYAEKLYNMYIMLGVDDNKAKDQVKEDLKTNIIEVDNHSYLKRDIVAFQAIDGIDNVPVYKKYIIKNNMNKDEDSDDYYLRHNGGGQFEIRRKVDLSPVYNKDNKPMIFYTKDLLEMKKQQTEEFKKDILEQQRRTQELRRFVTEQETMMP